MVSLVGLNNFSKDFLAAVTKNTTSETPKNLKDAVFHGDVQAATKFLAQDPHLISTSFADGMLPLHAAVRLNKKDLVQLFLEHGAQIQVKDFQGRTALDYAAAAHDSELVHLLLSSKIEEAKKRNGDFTYADAATINQELKKIEALKTTDLAKTKSNNPVEELIKAILEGNTENVDALLLKVKDFNICGKHGICPLHAAAAMKDSNALQKMMANQGDLLKKNKNGVAPADLLFAMGDKSDPLKLQKAQLLLGLFSLGSIIATTCVIPALSEEAAVVWSAGMMLLSTGADLAISYQAYLELSPDTLWQKVAYWATAVGAMPLFTVVNRIPPAKILWDVWRTSAVCKRAFEGVQTAYYNFPYAKLDAAKFAGSHLLSVATTAYWTQESFKTIVSAPFGSTQPSLDNPGVSGDSKPQSGPSSNVTDPLRSNKTEQLVSNRMEEFSSLFSLQGEPICLPNELDHVTSPNHTLSISSSISHSVGHVSYIAGNVFGQEMDHVAAPNVALFPPALDSHKITPLTLNVMDLAAGKTVVQPSYPLATRNIEPVCSRNTSILLDSSQNLVPNLASPKSGVILQPSVADINGTSPQPDYVQILFGNQPPIRPMPQPGQVGQAIQQPAIRVEPVSSATSQTGPVVVHQTELPSTSKSSEGQAEEISDKSDETVFGKINNVWKWAVGLMANVMPASKTMQAAQPLQLTSLPVEETVPVEPPTTLPIEPRSIYPTCGLNKTDSSGFTPLSGMWASSAPIALSVTLPPVELEIPKETPLQAMIKKVPLFPFLLKENPLTNDPRKILERLICTTYGDVATKEHPISLNELSSKEVSKRFRDLSLLIHPDKCVESFKGTCHSASAAFNEAMSSLKEARKDIQTLLPQAEIKQMEKCNSDNDKYRKRQIGFRNMDEYARFIAYMSACNKMKQDLAKTLKGLSTVKFVCDAA